MGADSPTLGLPQAAQAATERLFALVPVAVRRRAPRPASCARLASKCLCLAFVAVLAASVVPMWAVTRLQGSGGAGGLIAVEVDAVVADGLWTRGVCYGGAENLDEAVLNKLGLSCRGSDQLEGCFVDDVSTLSEEKRDHCERFMVAQAMQVGAVASALLATVAMVVANHRATTQRSRAGLSAVSLLAALVATYSVTAVADLVAGSYMFLGERALDYECQDMLGLQLCHGPGPSFRLEGLSSYFTFWALALSLVAACVVRARGARDDDTVVERTPGDVVVVSLSEDDVNAAAVGAVSGDARAPLLQPRGVVDAVAVHVAAEDEVAQP